MWEPYGILPDPVILTKFWLFQKREVEMYEGSQMFEGSRRSFAGTESGSDSYDISHQEITLTCIQKLQI